ncbi:MAG: tetratricopeptide repeat protein [Elusimicrobia bacterium]|nr:tetratricopeptide repeat protein [Elusimicrobiota bacterium]
MPTIHDARKRGNLAASQKLGLVAFGLFLAFLILEASLRLGGFAILSLQAHRNAISLRQKGAYRIMYIGESTTQRQFPEVLERTLNQRSADIRFSVIDRGMSGAHTSFIVDRLEADIEAYHPDAVVAMMGINDDGSHMPYPPRGSPASEFASRFRTYKLARIAWQAVKGQRPAEATAPLPPAAEYERGSHARAIAQFKKALELDPRDWAAYAGLGSSYQSLGRLKEAEAAFKEGLARNPAEARLHVELGWFYQSQSRFKDSAKAFSKAAAISPGHDDAYAGLGSSYQGQNDYAKALPLFERALESNPMNKRALEGMLWSAFYARKDLSRFRPLLERIRRAGSADDTTYAAMSTAYSAMGEPVLARQAREKAEGLRLRACNQVTAGNYRRLKELLDRRRIRLACVQYPMRGIAPLKRMLQGRDEGIIFVDNQRVFQDAVESGSFETYFQDMFGGDFGHCTAKGNELLARNIADVLLKEIFGIASNRP